MNTKVNHNPKALVLGLSLLSLLIPFQTIWAKTTAASSANVNQPTANSVNSSGPDLTSPELPNTNQTPNATPDRYYRARVMKILEEGVTDLGGSYKVPYQKLILQFTTGPETGKDIELSYGTDSEIKPWQKVKVGETVVVLASTAEDGELKYFIVDKYHLPAIALMVAIFLLLTIVLGKWKGFTSILGLVLSIGILIWFVIPKIVAGANPLWVSLAGAVMIVLVSLYLAHGFNKRTSIALLSTLLTLGVAVGLATVAANFAKVSGLGNEDAYYLQAGVLQNLDVRGLLLGGIIIGALGVLDDVTTGQAAAVDEIQKADPRLNASELYKRGLSVGKEHIASLVNTLALAYVGASFPLLLLFSTNHDQPLWLLLNSELVVEEIVRTLVGSMALLVAVPLTTFLAARLLAARETKRASN